MNTTVTQVHKVISYLTFCLGDEHFALNVTKVINILEMQKITKVPKAPEYMKGVINLRGEVLPIIDTNLKLSLGNTVNTGNTCILVAETTYEGQIIHFGILADSVQEVLEIEDEQILSPPSLGNSFKTDIISGVVEQGDQFIMILDINKLLDIEEIKGIEKLTRKPKK